METALVHAEGKAASRAKCQDFPFVVSLEGSHNVNGGLHAL